MIRKTASILLLTLSAQLASASVDRDSSGIIKEYALDPSTVYNIPIGNTPTTIAFPGPLVSIDAANISADAANGAPVLLNHVGGRYYFSVRANQPNAQAALNAIYKNRTYAFNFYHREDTLPYRAVRLVDPKDTNVFGPGIAQASREIRATSPTVLVGLLDRAKSYHIVNQAYPGKLDDVERIAASLPATEYRDFEASITEIFRFETYDTIVFKIRLRNKVEEDIFYQPQSVAVRIGQNLYYPSIADASGIIPALSESVAYIAITGKPNGQRANLSIRNAFQLIVSRISDPGTLAIP